MKNGAIWQWVVGSLIGLLIIVMGLMWQTTDARITRDTEQLNNLIPRVGMLETQANIQFQSIEKRLDTIERKIDDLNTALAFRDTR